ncbi:hypothetical protein L3X38_024142 [Prunus dulcis]|uniref:Uncharacterized protein n=1 Tax=Prunus dulcis TaxID=3755 RepID=A0AAD4W0U4_PRUDU|nr:hypothetical protein L3X38_024142 [Prunus dulcis]
MIGYVIGLNLGSCRLQGNIHFNSSLFSLGHLKRLDFSENDFRGSSISSKFGGFVTNGLNTIVQNLSNLKELQLSDVDISSVAPDSFKNISSSLPTLGLFDCQLQGKSPESISTHQIFVS